MSSTNQHFLMQNRLSHIIWTQETSDRFAVTSAAFFRQQANSWRFPAVCALLLFDQMLWWHLLLQQHPHQVLEGFCLHQRLQELDVDFSRELIKNNLNYWQLLKFSFSNLGAFQKQLWAILTLEISSGRTRTPLAVKRPRIRFFQTPDGHVTLTTQTLESIWVVSFSNVKTFLMFTVSALWKVTSVFISGRSV